MKGYIGRCGVVAVALVSILVLGSAREAEAYREPEFRTNLGGMPISCSVYPEQVGIGRVHTGDSMETVIDYYGRPNRITNERGTRYHYDGMVFTFIDYGGGPILADIKVTKNMRIGNNATPAGVGVGMSEYVLTQAYGTADDVYIEKHTAPKLSEEQNRKYDERFNKTVYTYYANECLTMGFVVTKGIIREIQIHLSD